MLGRTEDNAGQILSQFVLAPINNPSLNMNDSNDGNKDQMAEETPEVRSDKRKQECSYYCSQDLMMIMIKESLNESLNMKMVMLMIPHMRYASLQFLRCIHCTFTK